MIRMSLAYAWWVSGKDRGANPSRYLGLWKIFTNDRNLCSLYLSVSAGTFGRMLLRCKVSCSRGISQTLKPALDYAGKGFRAKFAHSSLPLVCTTDFSASQYVSLYTCTDEEIVLESARTDFAPPPQTPSRQLHPIFHTAFISHT